MTTQSGHGEWTFFGHWDNDEIVVEYIQDGRVYDPREDTGFWEQGLFASSAAGATRDEALTKVRHEYEDECGCGATADDCSAAISGQ